MKVGGRNMGKARWITLALDAAMAAGKRRVLVVTAERSYVVEMIDGKRVETPVKREPAVTMEVDEMHRWFEAGRGSKPGTAGALLAHKLGILRPAEDDE